MESDSDNDCSSVSDHIHNSNNCKKFEMVMTMINNAVNVKYTWLSKNKLTQNLPSNILQTIYHKFPEKCLSQKILCYTEIIKNGILYHADSNYRQSKDWYDNINVSWSILTQDKNNVPKSKINEHSILVPAKLLLFFRFHLETTIYCVIHSCHYKTEVISVLSRMWIHEFVDKKPKDIPSFKNVDKAYHLNATDPLLQIINTESIDLHCLLIPYQDTSCICIQIISPTEWADKFFALP